jgi:hypothetical protein
MGQIFSSQHEIVDFMKLKAENEKTEEIALSKAALLTALARVAAELTASKQI